MQVMASDADDPTYGSSARVVYSVLEGEQHFTVDSKTGQQHPAGLGQEIQQCLCVLGMALCLPAGRWCWILMAGALERLLPSSVPCLQHTGSAAASPECLVCTCTGQSSSLPGAGMPQQAH